MNVRRSLLTALLLISACATSRPAPPSQGGAAPTAGGPIELPALQFEVLEVSTFAPYYRDDARGALAIDAANHPNALAAARTTFKGPDGTYAVKLIARTETDGESTYRLSVNGGAVGEQQNAPDRPNYSEQEHDLGVVPLCAGNVLQVESNAHSNGKVPEGNAFGFARGRWTKLVLIPVQR